MTSIIDKIPAILVTEICKQVLLWLESTTTLYEMLEPDKFGRDCFLKYLLLKKYQKNIFLFLKN